MTNLIKKFELSIKIIYFCIDNNILKSSKLLNMGKTKGGKKKVHVPAHTKKVNGKKVKVKEHYRSTPD